MEAVLEIFNCGDRNRFWTYSVTINGKEVKSRSLIYRMYIHEKTAIRHGQSLLDAAIYFYLKNKTP